MSTIILFGINHNAVYLHCLWDNLLRYIFNTGLGLPYGISFFYPVPRSPKEIFPSWTSLHPTSEGLDFRNKFLLVLGSELSGFVIVKLILPWYETRQQRQSKPQGTSTGNKVQFQAGLNMIMERVYHIASVYYSKVGYQGPVEIFGSGQVEGETGVFGKEVMGSNTRNTVEKYEPTISEIGDSPLQVAHINIEPFTTLEIELKSPWYN